jgi:hypothetical protein
MLVFSTAHMLTDISRSECPSHGNGEAQMQSISQKINKNTQRKLFLSRFGGAGPGDRGTLGHRYGRQATLNCSSKQKVERSLDRKELYFISFLFCYLGTIKKKMISRDKSRRRL